MLVQNNSRGDTIIEVLLSMTLLTLIMFTAWGLVNRTTRISLDARKRIEMVNQLKEQAEILKSTFVQKGGSSNDIVAELTDATVGVYSSSDLRYDQNFCTEAELSNPDDSPGFYFEEKEKTVDYTKGSKPVDGNESSRVWVEYDSSASGYTDFYVRGCWASGGSQQTLDNSQLIVRLNK